MKTEAIEKARKILEDRAEELVKYTFRSRVKHQLGQKAVDLTASDINPFKQRIVKDKLQEFRGILNDFLA